MKFAAIAVTLSLYVAGASAGSKIPEIRSRRSLTKSFLDAMNEPTIEAARKMGHAAKLRKLHEGLKHASRKLEQYNGEYQYEDEFEYVAAPFDMTARSFKYAACSAIKTYDEDRAQQTGNPITMDTYAVFRLCPADSCNQYSATGCGSNYGEYAIEMKTYLSYVLDYYDNRYEEYCEFCLACDSTVAAEMDSYLEQCYYTQNQAQAQAEASANAQAYNNYYSANSGGDSAYNNGNGFDNYNQYYNGADNGNRKLEQANEEEEAQDQNVNQNAQAYGYYDQENGEWVDGQGQADDSTGYWGEDGVYYAYNPSDYGLSYECSDGSACDLCTWQMEQTYGVCDDYICSSYYTYCSDMYQSEEEANFDVRDYLDCQPFVDENGEQYYIAPHCGSNHFTVSLGVFSDDNCVDYIGESVSLTSVLGFQYSDDDLFQLPKDCISCDGTEEEVDEEANNNGRYGAYVTSPETTEDGTVAMCSALYQGSAQCNMNMNNFETISAYMSAYEIEMESRYCSFIKNIITGSYDETGEVQLTSSEFSFDDFTNLSQYKTIGISPIQATGLAASIVICIAMAATAAFTARALSRQSTPWKPKRGTDANGLSRQNSGIVMGRSRSGPGAAPLI